MGAEGLVISCDLAKLLHAAGVQAETYFVWIRYVDMEDRHRLIARKHVPMSDIDRAYAAFTLGELMVLLGQDFASLTAVKHIPTGQIVRFIARSFHASQQVGPTPEDALGQLLLEVQQGNR